MLLPKGKLLTLGPFFYRIMMIFCATIQFTQKAAELGKTKLHTNKESYDFKISPNIPTVYVMLYINEEKLHVLL